MTRKEKYLLKIEGTESDAVQLAKERIKNREWLNASQQLAVKILMKLDDLNLTQKDLAAKLGVTAQYVNKLLKGKEKFGWEMLVAIQYALDMPILLGYQQKLDLTSKSYNDEIEIEINESMPLTNKEIENKEYCKIIPLFGDKSEILDSEYESYEPALEM